MCVEEKLLASQGDLVKGNFPFVDVYLFQLYCQTNRLISDLVRLAEQCIVGGINE